MSLGPLPSSAPIGSFTTEQGKQVPVALNTQFNAWLSQLQAAVKPLGGNGATAARPIAGLYIGLLFFDATLGYPVFVKSLNPTVWVNGAGGVV
jgi:hypothetical protein